MDEKMLKSATVIFVFISLGKSTWRLKLKITIIIISSHHLPFVSDFWMLFYLPQHFTIFSTSYSPTNCFSFLIVLYTWLIFVWDKKNYQIVRISIGTLKNMANIFIITQFSMKISRMCQQTYCRIVFL